MGFAPEQVNRMSVWEFLACCEGLKIKNGGASKKKRKPARPMSPERLRELGIKGA